MTRVLLSLLLLSVLAHLVGCGGNAAVKSARRSLVAGDARAAYARIEAEARESDDTDVLLALAEVAAMVGRDSVAHASLARVETRGDRERERSKATRARIWRTLFASAQAVVDTLDRAGPDARTSAVATLERAESFEANRAATAASLGTLRLDAGEIAGSDSLFSLAVARAGSDKAMVRPVVTALVRAASVHRDGRRLESAVALGRETVRIAPDDARARFDHGVNLHALAEKSGDAALFGEAIEQFESVLERVPGDVDAGYNLSLSHFRLGDADRARQAMAGLLPRAPLDPRIHRLAARLALSAGDRDAARPHVVAMRALEGTTRSIPISALLVSTAAGRAGAKRYALDGPPERVNAYTERSGSLVEAWFYPALGRMYGYSGGVLVATLDWSTGDP